MDKSTVLVLGSGATLGGGFNVEIRGTRFEPPLDGNFFENPAVQSIFTPGNYPALAHYRQDPSLEATWAKIDLLLKLCLSGVVSEEQTYEQVRELLKQKGQGDSSYQQKMERECCHSCVPSMAEWELRNLVRVVYLDLHAPEPTQESPLYKLVDALRKDNLLCGVITFNYDTSLKILFRGQFQYPSLQTERVDTHLPLMKLHGSLNWQETPPNITLVNGIAEIRYQNGAWTQPAVIGPTFFKQEITIDFQPDYRAKFYKQLWRFAWDVLRNARNLIFVGFSFPQTDFHARALFRTAHLNHLNGNGFRHVVLCHRGNQDLRNAAEQVFRGRPTEFTEFNGGLENMTERIDEVIALLH